MSQLLYFLLLKPLSLLPLPLLYRCSTILFYLVYYVIPYRKKVVLSNLKNSFPEKDQREIEVLVKLFYRHFCDLIIESIRLFSISEEEAISRCRVTNPEIFSQFVEKNQSLIIVAGHYGNWELAGVALNSQIPHQAIGFYTPMKNRFFDLQFRTSRSRFGLKVTPSKKVRHSFEKRMKQLTATVFIGDQSPSNVRKQLHWTTFLNQETGVMLGAEKMARHYNYPVLYGNCRKIKRGYYEVSFEIIEKNSRTSGLFEITEKHTRILEKEIFRVPQYWLWTHRRWKRKRLKTDKLNT